MDVKNVFLHGTLIETVYFLQPSGFADPSYPNHVCRLNNSLYGLKQASHTWYSRFATHIISLGFVEARTNPSLFIYCRGNETTYLLLYIDDIVLAASSTTFLNRIVASLCQEFSMTGMGELHHFLGMTVCHTSDGLLLDQRQYMLDLLDRACMSDCKTCNIVVDTQSKLSVDGPPVADPSYYHNMAGALQYLTFPVQI